MVIRFETIDVKLTRSIFSLMISLMCTQAEESETVTRLDFSEPQVGCRDGYVYFFVDTGRVKSRDVFTVTIASTCLAKVFHESRINENT